MGEILHTMGVLARDHVEETSGRDLTGNYIGQTKGIVEAKMQAAAGGILFIDEAYDLGDGAYGKEAMTTLLRLLTGMLLHISVYVQSMFSVKFSLY